jgi:hypothetical protein
MIRGYEHLRISLVNLETVLRLNLLNARWLPRVINGVKQINRRHSNNNRINLLKHQLERMYRKTSRYLDLHRHLNLQKKRFIINLCVICFVFFRYYIHDDMPLWQFPKYGHIYREWHVNGKFKLNPIP